MNVERILEGDCSEVRRLFLGDVVEGNVTKDVIEALALALKCDPVTAHRLSSVAATCAAESWRRGLDDGARIYRESVRKEGGAK